MGLYAFHAADFLICLILRQIGHFPVCEVTSVDLFRQQDFELVMAAVGFDFGDQFVDVGLVALKDLNEASIGV